MISQAGGLKDHAYQGEGSGTPRCLRNRRPRSRNRNRERGWAAGDPPLQVTKSPGSPGGAPGAGKEAPRVKQDGLRWQCRQRPPSGSLPLLWVPQTSPGEALRVRPGVSAEVRGWEGADRVKGIWADWRKAGMRDSPLSARLCVPMGTHVHDWAPSLGRAQENSVEGSHGLGVHHDGKNRAGRCHVSCLLPPQG